MKKKYKVLLIIALCTLGIGLATGAASVILFIQHSVDYSGYDKALTDEMINTIDIELSGGELIVKQGDAFNIHAENIMPDELICEVSDGTWRIAEQAEKNTFTVLGWRVADDILDRIISGQPPKVIITVPQETILETAKLCVNSGNVKLSSLRVQNLIIQVGAGQVKANNCKAFNSLWAQIGAGCLEAEQFQVNDSIIKCGIGNVDIQGDIEGAMKIESSVGRTCLKIDGLLDSREYNTHCNAGIIEIGDVGVAGIGIDALHNGTDNNEDIDVSCGIGKIEIIN